MLRLANLLYILFLAFFSTQINNSWIFYKVETIHSQTIRFYIFLLFLGKIIRICYYDFSRYESIIYIFFAFFFQNCLLVVNDIPTFFFQIPTFSLATTISKKLTNFNSNQVFFVTFCFKDWRSRFFLTCDTSKPDLDFFPLNRFFFCNIAARIKLLLIQAQFSRNFKQNRTFIQST